MLPRMKWGACFPVAPRLPPGIPNALALAMMLGAITGCASRTEQADAEWLKAFHSSAGNISTGPGDSGIDFKRIDSTTIQRGPSCVLASYAVVANYFTETPVRRYFEAYCGHFGIACDNPFDAEQKHAAHFDREWRKRRCRGYEVILDLHENSNEDAFATARRHFSPRFLLNTASHLDNLEQILDSRDVLLNITFQIGGNAHSVTVFGDGSEGYVVRDTTRRDVYRINRLTDFGKLRDSVVYIPSDAKWK